MTRKRWLAWHFPWVEKRYVLLPHATLCGCWRGAKNFEFTCGYWDARYFGVRHGCCGGKDAHVLNFLALHTGKRSRSTSWQKTPASARKGTPNSRTSLGQWGVPPQGESMAFPFCAAMWRTPPPFIFAFVHPFLTLLNYDALSDSRTTCSCQIFWGGLLAGDL